MKSKLNNIGAKKLLKLAACINPVLIAWMALQVVVASAWVIDNAPFCDVVSAIVTCGCVLVYAFVHITLYIKQKLKW